MPFNIEFDYRFDTEGFYTPAVRAALEFAADVWEDIILDDFPTFEAGNSFTLPANLPGLEGEVTLTSDVDDLIIFVSASSDNAGPLASASSTGYNVAGDMHRLRIVSDFREMGATTDFEPFAGQIWFNSFFDWGTGLATPEPDKFDLASTAIHEIGHILGIGNAFSFENFIEGTLFRGPNSLMVTGGVGIRFDDDLDHITNDQPGGPHALDTFNQRGERQLPTDFDKAILADMGYEIAGFTKQGSPFDLATEGGERIFGSIIDDVIDGLGGDDRIVGNMGDDRLRGGEGDDSVFGDEGSDTLSGGAGKDSLFGNEGDDSLVGGTGDDSLSARDGVDTLLAGPGDDTAFGGDGNDLIFGSTGDDQLLGDAGADSIRAGSGENSVWGGDGADRLFIGLGDGETWGIDFNFAEDVLVIDPAFGFSTASAVLAQVETTAGAQTVDLGNGGMIRVSTDPGEALSAANIAFGTLSTPSSDGGGSVPGTPGNDSLTGTAGSDTVVGGDGFDVLTGGDGVDVLRGDAGSDVLIGGAARDAAGQGDVALFAGVQSSYDVSGGTEYAVVTSPDGTRDKLFGVSVLRFDDGDVTLGAGSALDGAGAPESFLISERVALLYEAALNRDGAIDLPGLNFYIDVTERDGLSDTFLAQDLMTSPEFTANFGDANTLTNDAFLDRVYLNVLNRAPDASGKQFYLDLLEAGTISKALALADIAVSPENTQISADILMGLYEAAPGDWAFL